MSEFKGTPGQWKYGVRNNNGLMISFCGVFIGEVFLDITTSNDRKDARLIAAAPELLDALQKATNWIDAVPKDIPFPTMPDFDRDWVESVISKALG